MTADPRAITEAFIILPFNLYRRPALSMLIQSTQNLRNDHYCATRFKKLSREESSRDNLILFDRA
jgi:hypothetical protein